MKSNLKSFLNNKLGLSKKKESMGVAESKKPVDKPTLPSGSTKTSPLKKSST
jgi:hypothetical protein